MQYVKNVTDPQSLIFAQPVDYDASTTLKFTSYENNFEVVGSASILNHFLQVAFTLTEEQAALFDSGTTFKVSFGDAYDFVQGDVPSDNVIQYQPE